MKFQNHIKRRTLTANIKQLKYGFIMNNVPVNYIALSTQLIHVE